MQKKKGISLIVLVITIIVMIVLAGAIILSLNNAGIIEKANDAVSLTDEANINEFAQILWSEAYLKPDNSKDVIKTYVLTGLTNAGINIEEYAINVTEKGVSVTKSVAAMVDGVPIPKGFVASNATGENTASKGLVIYEGSETVTDANVEVARRSRNQYVWVPVDRDTFDTNFARKNFGIDRPISTILGRSYWEVLPTTEINDTNLKYMTKETLEEVQSMYESVKKYGGFYVARYEMGIDKHRKAKGVSEDLPGIKEGTSIYSVMGKIPYTYVPWTWNDKMNEDTNGAVEIARRVYTQSNSNYGVVSTLIYGVQWDSVVQWFINTGAMTLEEVNRTTGSTAYGNYSDHIINTQEELNEGALVWNYTANSSGSYVEKDSETITYPKTSGTSWALSTGALKTANINNIYDMAGNMYEWTMEGLGSLYRSIRGGRFYTAGTGETISKQETLSPRGANFEFGFRTALYIK